MQNTTQTSGKNSGAKLTCIPRNIERKKQTREEKRKGKEGKTGTWKRDYKIGTKRH